MFIFQGHRENTIINNTLISNSFHPWMYDEWVVCECLEKSCLSLGKKMPFLLISNICWNKEKSWGWLF